MDLREPVVAANRYPGRVEITPLSGGPKFSRLRRVPAVKREGA
ncbi:hypothetical protein DealDRAFT_1420 [Dethiobacter alkaliphilus AHT 1]|uniref:Uncharacterized protein n=1 Tax=Dethiobacter alkaliphilus AHT 1 TaxID=555088 RepID=C0GG11_DETAL|nr:hypothetical protein DealDRAFT_1420 [Dethiobacter alkaliphilus AHT 1]